MFKSLVVAGSALFWLVGCDNVGSVSVVATADTEIDGGVIAQTTSALGFDAFTSYDVTTSKSFRNSGASRSNIGDDSYVTQFTLRVTDPEGQTLSFIDSMEVFIDSDDNPDNGETRVAYLGDEQETNVRELNLKVYDDRAIGQYLRADETVIRVHASGDAPQNPTTVEAEMHFNIDLNW